MSQPAVSITPRHYQALSGVALTAMFLLQVQGNISPYLNVLMLVVGLISLANVYTFSPIAVLIALAAGQLLEQYQQNELFPPDPRSVRSFNVATLILCVSTLTYLIGHYRLQGLRFGVLPYDPRQESAAAQARSAESLTAVELAALVIPIPLCALLADFAALLLKQHWTVVGMSPRWKQFLALAWLVLGGLFIAAQLFRYWRRLQMDRPTAQLLLQDSLWNETRGEQRRLNRWIAWKKLKDKFV